MHITAFKFFFALARLSSLQLPAACMHPAVLRCAEVAPLPRATMQVLIYESEKLLQLGA